MKTKKIGFIAGILVALIIHFLPLQGIEPAGQTCLALTLMTVVWWATQVAQSGYVGGIYLILLIVLGVAEPELVFKSWTGSTMYLIIGAYLIASAVKDSGLGERIAYAFIIKFVTFLQRDSHIYFCADLYYEYSDSPSMAEGFSDHVCNGSCGEECQDAKRGCR